MANSPWGSLRSTGSWRGNTCKKKRNTFFNLKTVKMLKYFSCIIYLIIAYCYFVAFYWPLNPETSVENRSFRRVEAEMLRASPFLSFRISHKNHIENFRVDTGKNKMNVFSLKNCCFFIHDIISCKTHQRYEVLVDAK